MSFIRSLALERCVYIVAIIFLFNEIMPTYSYYMLKGLVYIIIIAPLSYQPFFYIKCTKLNIHLSYDVRLVSNIEYIFFLYFYILQSLQLFYLICLRVLRNGCYKET